MQTEKDLSINQSSKCLFQDRYQILALAAHPTFTKTSSVLKVRNDLCLRVMQWRKSLKTLIKQLFQYPANFSDSVWYQPEGETRECLQKERKQHD